MHGRLVAVVGVGVGLPAAGVPARLLEHVLAEREDQPGLLGERHELRGSDQAAAGCSQRTSASAATKPPVSSDTIGWKYKRELVALDRQAQLLLEAVALEHLGAHADVEDLEGPLARGLGLVHRDVGVADQVLGRDRALMVGGDADARVDRNAVGPHHHRGRERVHDPARHARGRHLRVAVLDHHRELVAAEPRDEILGPQAGAQPQRDRDQQLVAGGMAEAVVDRLEVVEVDEQDRDLAAAGRDRLLDLLGEQRRGWRGW